jgi:eukaryotic-like serine/threonine-protein kinase
MESPIVAEAFLELLEKSGLLPADQIAAAVARFALPAEASARDLAIQFLNGRLLTRYQAERLLEGKSRGFFIDQYKILEILGAGGMACLYLAEDQKTRERVALKVISDRHKADAGMLARLKLEARAGRKLNHPAIIRTIDIRTTDDVYGETYYLVMEFVPGVNLEELINMHGPIPWAQAADFARQAAEGLQVAHQAGLVHRDVKPGNLLVDRAGNLKILDFGLALVDSRRDSDADEFSLAMIFGHNCLGTADYIAPEQITDSFAIDCRADIYSLGCTLYVAVSGKLPFPAASSTEKLDGHLNKTAIPLSVVVPTVPPELAAVVARMMAKRPADRYQTMAEVVQALAPFAQRKPVEFEFPKVLAGRAKQARHRIAGQNQSLHGSRASSTMSRSSSIPALRSASTKRLPQAQIETAVVSPIAAAPGNAPNESGFVRKGSVPAPAPASPATAAADSPMGTVLIPLNDGPAVPLTKPLIVIGRDLDCDVAIASPLISGKHCELHFDGTGWRVLDLGSKNGVQVNGRPASDEPLSPGDRLSLAAQVHFRIEYAIQTPEVSPRTRQWLAYAIVVTSVIAAALYAISHWMLR